MIYLVRYNQQYAYVIKISSIHGGVPSLHENDWI